MESGASSESWVIFRTGGSIGNRLGEAIGAVVRRSKGAGMAIEPNGWNEPAAVPEERPLIAVWGRNPWMMRRFANPPAVVVMADGHRILPVLEDPNAPLPRPRAGILPDDVVERAALEMELLAGVDLHSDGSVLSDQGTLTVKCAGHWGQPILLEAYGLSLGVSKYETGPRRLLQLAIDSLMSGPQDTAYQPVRIRITRINQTGGRPLSLVGDRSDEGAEPLAWPGPPLARLFPKDSSAPSHALAGAACAQVLDVLGTHPTLSTWTDDSDEAELFINLLYPGDAEQPDGPGG